MFRNLISKSALISALVLTLAPQAFASRARIATLFTGDGGNILSGGSLYYDDQSNIFYNPSFVNDHKNWGIIEKSNGTGSAEAGFITSFMNFCFGAYFNRSEGITGSYVTGATDMKPVELYLGSDWGVKWGLGLGVARAGADKADTTLRLGAQFMDFEPFLDVKLVGRDATTGTEIKNNDLQAGVRYKWGEWMPYAAVRLMKTETAGLESFKSTSFGAGIARNTRLMEGVNLSYSLSVWGNTVNGGSFSQWPIEIGVEGEAASWITVRGGFSYRNAAAARLGATIKAGKMDIDWAFGSTAGGENLNGTTFDLANGLFSLASLTYRW